MRFATLTLAARFFLSSGLPKAQQALTLHPGAILRKDVLIRELSGQNIMGKKFVIQ